MSIIMQWHVAFQKEHMQNHRMLKIRLYIYSASLQENISKWEAHSTLSNATSKSDNTMIAQVRNTTSFTLHSILSIAHSFIFFSCIHLFSTQVLSVFYVL